MRAPEIFNKKPVKKIVLHAACYHKILVRKYESTCIRRDIYLLHRIIVRIIYNPLALYKIHENGSEPNFWEQRRKSRIGYDRAACVSFLTKRFENHLTVFVWQGVVRGRMKVCRIVNIEVGQVCASPSHVLRSSRPLLCPPSCNFARSYRRERQDARSRRKIEEDQQEQTRDLEHDCTAHLRRRRWSSKGAREVSKERERWVNAEEAHREGWKRRNAKENYVAFSFQIREGP